ncbi:PREDICTED: zinc finger MYM-type protein 1-like [Ipomoea nil]|uniref:zinc finger MYM-type protein 1-like n=1 Tax=Ipomoea nil TaxID=35883 RepID=UPI000901623D|nr:PREDICTED: zinc finger MYM-type protein 1-like [Ipomoea nil]
MKKTQKIDTFFKRKNSEDSSSQVNPSTSVDQLNSESRPGKSQRIEINEKFDIQALERDPGLRLPIWMCPVDKRDEVRRAYIKAGPYQCLLSKYPKSGEKHPRSFQASWFKLFPSWLEYSPSKDAAFCLPCYLFHTQDGPSGLHAFTTNGFCSWKKVRDGKNCSFLAPIGKDLTSPHRNAEKACSYLMNQQSHIAQHIEKFTSQEVVENRLRLRTSIEATRWLAFQGCSFRGDDESITSTNRGNFLELLSFIASFNDEVTKVLDKAPRNATYTSPTIQKQILQVLATKVKSAIREEIGDAKFCIIVDEARDESKKEQMSIVLRFVDRDGFIQERFFGVVHVKDTIASTLKEGIFSILSRHNLDVQNIRGQGYDGASNMRGEWNGLKALILDKCPYAYYVHCFAHRLQLALVASSKKVIPVHHFFTKLNSIINVVGASCKRNDQLKAAHASNIAHLLSIDELKSGRGLNQIGSLQRPGDTRWSSHLKSISSLMRMFSATCEVLLNIIEDGTTPTHRGDADAAYEVMTSFEFVFIMHLMRKVLEISNMLCQALQLQSQDILNAMHLVTSTKLLIQKLRDSGWDELVSSVKSFCENVNISVPDFDAQYIARRGRARNQQDELTVGHHYKVDIFNAVIDSQLQELNNRFDDKAMELIVLSSSLDPKEMRISFRIDDICKLVEKFYPQDFADYEILQLRMQLEHFEHVQQLPDFKELESISDLCQWMVKTRKLDIYPLVFRIVTLILTLPVSTATTERSFSAMKIVKTTLRNKMDDQFFNDCLLVYIEKQIAKQFSIDSIIDDFRDMQERRSKF